MDAGERHYSLEACAFWNLIIAMHQRKSHERKLKGNPSPYINSRDRLFMRAGTRAGLLFQDRIESKLAQGTTDKWALGLWVRPAAGESLCEVPALGNEEWLERLGQ